MAVTSIGTGTTLTYSGFSGELLSCSWSGISREAIDVSHMGTAAADDATTKLGNRAFVPGGLVDPGTLSCEVHFNSEQFVPFQDLGADDPNTTATLTIKWPARNLASANWPTWSASAFVLSYSVEDPLDDKMTATIEFKLTGNITFAS